MTSVIRPFRAGSPGPGLSDRVNRHSAKTEHRRCNRIERHTRYFVGNVQQGAGRVVAGVSVQVCPKGLCKE